MTGAGPARILPDGRRLHLQHGPIDLIIEAMGRDGEIRAAYAQATHRFADVLDRLVDELSLLRTPIAAPRPVPAGACARRMIDAVWPHRAIFVTPMAAVAGAVADEMLAALTAGRTLPRAYVNNSGDIAIHLAPGESLTLGIVGEIGNPAIDATAVLTDKSPVRGIATSGWQGRSWSLGIADAVTVLAPSAAGADAAATLIANEVNIEPAAVTRRPAEELDSDTDLGRAPVTTAVGPLEPKAIAAALDRGAACARAMHGAGHITAAMLVLRRHRRIVGEARALIARGEGEQ